MSRVKNVGLSGAPRKMSPAVPATTPAAAERTRKYRSRKLLAYRHDANSGRSGDPMRMRSSPSLNFARPISPVDARWCVPRYSRSHCSIASHRSSSGVRFQRPHFAQTTHSLPFAPSNASRLPTGKCSTASFLPSDEWQKMQVEYKYELRCRE